MAVRKYVYDGDAVLQETDGAGATLTEYTRTGGGYGDLLSAYDGTSAKYYEPDALGSTDALADQAQAVADRWGYRAFGSATQTAGTDVTPFTWVGRQGYFADSDTGLYLLGSGTRFYDPATARFISPDPIGFVGGDVSLYHYVANSPVDLVDPSGLRAAPGMPVPPGFIQIGGNRGRLIPTPPVERPGPVVGPTPPGGFQQSVAEANKRCWDKLYSELKSLIGELAENPPGRKSGHSTKHDKRGGRVPGGIGNKINALQECLEKFEKGEAPAEKLKACLDAACEFAGEAGPVVVFCKIWKGLMIIDACAAAAVLAAGTVALGEDPLNRFGDDWAAFADCLIMSNQVSCKNCCTGRFRTGKLSEDAYSKCTSACEARPEFGR